MIDERFIVLGVIIGSFGIVSYLVDTIRGKVKPNRVTWLLWALAPLIAFVAEIKQGVGIHSAMTFMVGFGPLLIFFASFVNKKAYWKLTKLDYTCGAFSILGLVLWYITEIENLAILFAIMADGTAAIPTLIKAWKAPETENYVAFLLSMISAGITLLAIKIWNFPHYAFPVYILIIDIIFFTLIKYKIGNIFTKKNLKADPV